MDAKKNSVNKRVKLLVDALDGIEKINEALSKSEDGEEMLDILLDEASKLRLGLSRNDLMTTPPIRDWIWWKNKNERPGRQTQI